MFKISNSLEDHPSKSTVNAFLILLTIIYRLRYGLIDIFRHSLKLTLKSNLLNQWDKSGLVITQNKQLNLNLLIPVIGKQISRKKDKFKNRWNSQYSAGKACQLKVDCINNNIDHNPMQNNRDLKSTF